MEDATKYVYLKFQIDKRISKMTGFILSEDRATVDEWQGPDKTVDEQEQSIASEESDYFIGIAKGFPKPIEVFRLTVPFIMNNLPVLRILHDDDLIRNFVKHHGTELDKGEFETYRISIEHIGELTRRLDNSIAIGAGADKLPSLFLVGLISAYDAFLAQAIKAMFLTQPGLLSSSDRSISFKDLMEFGSMEVAINRIIEKEVESVLRENHADQVKWIENKLGIPLRKNLKVWPKFIELCERRNLFTHTGGVISSQYIDVCKVHGYDDMNNATVGHLVEIDPVYYSKAVEIILEMGSKLIQVVWRKLRPDDIQSADETLNRFCYDLIVKKMYGLAAIMLEFGLYEMKKHGSEAIRRQMVVNYANAEKLQGNKEKANHILDEEDWTASTDQYRICVAAVKDDVDRVIELMRPVVDGKLLNLSHFRDWPVFEMVRSEPKFIEAFEREFAQKLFVNKQASSLQQLSADADREPGSAKSEQAEVAPTLFH